MAYGKMKSQAVGRPARRAESPLSPAGDPALADPTAAGTAAAATAAPAAPAPAAPAPQVPPPVTGTVVLVGLPDGLLSGLSAPGAPVTGVNPADAAALARLFPPGTVVDPAARLAVVAPGQYEIFVEVPPSPGATPGIVPSILARLAVQVQPYQEVWVRYTDRQLTLAPRPAPAPQTGLATVPPAPSALVPAPQGVLDHAKVYAQRGLQVAKDLPWKPIGITTGAAATAALVTYAIMRRRNRKP
jgi:hypothetical protein